MARRIHAILSDTHGGHRLGLLNPDTELIRETDTGDWEVWCPELTATEVWMWEMYGQIIAELEEFAHGDEIIVSHTGDATTGDRHPGCISDISREDQRKIAYYNLLPLLMLPNVTRGRLNTGTAVHVVESAEARIAKMLAEKTGKDVCSSHHSRIMMGESIFDMSHHGPPPGSRDWLHGNVALIYLRDRIYRDRRLGCVPANAYMRGHFHDWVHVTLNDRYRGQSTARHLCVLPSMCGLTEFARKVTRSEPSLTIGMAACEVVDGQLGQIHPLLREIDLRSEEAL